MVVVVISHLGHSPARNIGHQVQQQREYDDGDDGHHVLDAIEFKKAFEDAQSKMKNLTK